MADHQISAISHRKIVTWLLAATICYQAAYQGIWWYSVQRGNAEGDVCRNSAGVVLSSSPQCLERELFRNWQRASEAAGASSAFDMAVVKEPGPPSEQAPAIAQGDRPPSSLSTTSAGGLGVEEISAGRTDDWKVFVHDRAVEFDRLFNSTMESLNNQSVVTPWAQSLIDEQARMEAIMANLPSVRTARAQQRVTELEFDRIFNATMQSLNNSSDGLTQWARELAALQERMEGQMQQLPSQLRGGALRAQAKQDQDTSLMNRIMQFGRELCEVPYRRGRPECAQFLQMYNTSERSANGTEKLARQAAKATWRENITAEAAKRAADFNASILKLVSDRKAWEVQFVRNVTSFVSQLAPSMSAGDDGPGAAAPLATPDAPIEAWQSHSRAERYMRRLLWSPVTAWGAQKRGNNASIMTIVRDQVRHARWQGMIPKVACITAVTFDRGLKNRMALFIDNFYLQDYEGPRQLVLVYHHRDSRAAQIVQTYVDGVFIKSVVAFGEGDFPSTTALRYGAWASDADVVARWDFEEWHHPQRLAMQVRSIALAARPACLMASEGGGIESEESLVGEKSWMQAHWHPLLKEGSVTLHHTEDHHLVQVAMPELFPKVRAALAVSHTSSDTKPDDHTGAMANEVTLEGMCRELNHAGESEKADEDSTEARIVAKLGSEMGETYQRLRYRYRTITSNLRSLCVEAVAQKDPAWRTTMRYEAQRMASIRLDMIEHFQKVQSLFALAA